MGDENYQYKNLTYDVIGCAMEVHNELGPGFLEPAYEEALWWELENNGIRYEGQAELKIDYKGEPLNKTYRADLIIENKIIIELKAVKKLTDIHVAQVIHYLKVTKIDVGLLINFGKSSLEWERFVDT